MCCGVNTPASPPQVPPPLDGGTAGYWAMQPAGTGVLTLLFYIPMIRLLAASDCADLMARFHDLTAGIRRKLAGRRATA